MKIGRNDSCPCGSGKKYKRCCLNKLEYNPSQEEIKDIIATINASKEPEPYLDIVPSIIWKNYRFRAIWDKLYYRPITETFHEFILIILKETFGEKWWQDQAKLQLEKRHILLHWFESYKDWTINTQTIDNKEPDREAWGAIPSGEVQALASFAYDIYCLQLVNKLPLFIIKKLRNRSEFQSARYEIAIAAIIARAGFDIDFLDDKVKSEKHCEFIAKHKKTSIQIGVEAKSRHRKGVLHQEGEFDYEAAIKGDIRHLLRKARSQKPPNLPFVIFIDLNIPPTPNIGYKDKPWIKDINNILDNYGKPTNEKPDPFNMLVFTNFSYYYGGNDEPTPQGEYIMIISPLPETPLNDPTIINLIFNSLKRYSQIPKEI